MLSLVVAIVSALSPVAVVTPATTAPVVAAERAFAADGLTMGVRNAFLKHSAPEAIVFQPGPVKAQSAYGAQPDEAGPKLEWWPVWAGVSRDGDLGFTTGPYSIDGVRKGHYFTVWKRQAGGGWKWIFDGGAAADPKTEPGPDGPVAVLPLSPPPPAGGAASPEPARIEVAALEADLAQAAARDQKSAHLARLAADGRLYVASVAPAKSKADFDTVLSAWPATFAFSPLGLEAADSGDLVWTYGDARWSRDGQARHGHYVHVWQKRAEGWKLVFAEIAPAPPAKP